MSNVDKDGNFDPVGASRGVGWHSDLCYETIPAKATLLHSIEVPDRGGDTLFANMHMAWETMPAALKLGRAECRDRVCPYVEVSVGAVLLKKKKKLIKKTKNV